MPTYRLVPDLRFELDGRPPAVAARTQAPTSTPVYDALTRSSSRFVRTTPSGAPAFTRAPSSSGSGTNVPPPGDITMRQSGVCSA